jgi:uncharacterized protein (TIGR01777 family)
MRILLTGGTGFIGRALCSSLLAQGHELTVLSRQPATVTSRLSPQVTAWGSLDEWSPGQVFDAVINLAGLPIIDAAWTPARKQALWASRVSLTEHLVARIKASSQPPAVLLSGSAIGYYGNTGDTVVNEDNPVGQDYGAGLCAAWEQAAWAAAEAGVRVCVLRTGLVLHRSGGMLGRLLWPFRLGLGGPIGGGGQWMSWIHRDDEIGIIEYLLNNPDGQGIYNLTAPNPVSNAEFTRTLAEVLHRPAVFRVPALLLHWMLGERAELLLGSQNVRPERLLALGYAFRYPHLKPALN